MLGFGLLGLAAALVLSLQISRGLSVPIRELVAATSEIQRGNFSIQVPVRTRDEVGRLAGSFNEMASGLELKERYRSLLDLVADKEVAAELLSGGFALGGELRDVTVLFCDIRGFTALTEHMSPADVVELVNEHMTAMTAVVYEHQRRGRQVRRRSGDGAVRRSQELREGRARCGAVRARHDRGAPRG